MFIDISLILFGAIFRHEETTRDIICFKKYGYDTSGHPVVEPGWCFNTFGDEILHCSNKHKGYMCLASLGDLFWDG